MVLRAAMLWIAGNATAERVVRKAPLTKPLVARFVAGETLDAAVEVGRDLATRHLTTTLDLLGENVSDRAAAEAACNAYIGLLDRLQQEGLAGNISIKLTMLGLDIDDTFCAGLLARIVGHAAELDAFVRVDMEAAAYTQRTLDLFTAIHDQHPAHVGIVLQSYLYRTDEDLEAMIARGARIRIVKGAYREEETVAYAAKSDVDAAYRRHIERLLAAGHYPAIATHDEAMIALVRQRAQQHALAPARYEFQMLLGVRRDLQEALVSEGFTVRVYVPYGTAWYPYFTRRLAERPANILFVARSLWRDRR